MKHHLHSPPHRHGRRAFTLLETLLAMMIFSMAVVSLVEAVQQLGNTTLFNRREATVQERMRSLLTERTRLPLPTEEITTIKEDDITYTISHQRLELQDKDGQNVEGLFEVRVIAEWIEGRTKQQASAETWLYPPLFQRFN